MTDKFLY